MGFDRTTILRGPAKITFDDATFYSKGGVAITFQNITFDKETDAYGVVGKGKTDVQILVEFEPVGELESLTVLFPYGNTAIGSKIYGSSDKALVVVAADATYTIKNAAITQMPSLRLTATNTAFGPVQFTGLLDLATGEPDDPASYFTVGAGASIGTAFDPALIVASGYSGLLGDADFYTEAGFDITFDLALNPMTVDGFGTVGMTLSNVGASISFIPTGVGADFFDALFIDGAVMGADPGAQSLTLTSIAGDGLVVAFPLVNMTDMQHRFSPTENRLGQVNLTAKRTFNAGAQTALFGVSINT
jgi:hypothetical protein